MKFKFKLGRVDRWVERKLSANSFLVQCFCCGWFDFYSKDFSTWVSLSQLLRSCHVFKFNVCLPAKWLYQTRVFNTACFLPKHEMELGFSRSLLFQLGAPMELQVASLEILWEKHGQPGILRAFPGRARTEAFWVSEHGISQFNIVSDIVQDVVQDMNL